MSWRASISRNVASVKLMACTSSPASAAAREWYINSYKDVMALNPRFSFMIRPNPDATPYMVVEYDFGRKVKVDLAGDSTELIDAKLKAAVAAGAEQKRSYHQSEAPFRLPDIVE